MIPPAMQASAGQGPASQRAPGPIIAATDGKQDADGAMIAARLVSERTGAVIQVVSVIEPLLLAMADSSLSLSAGDLAEAQGEAQRAAVNDQLARLKVDRGTWPVTFSLGQAASVLAGIAHDRRAALLVVGRGRHSAVSRLVLGETVTRLLQLANVPVLAVEPDVTALARRVVIATDFSRYSVYAARVALTLVDPKAKFQLAYVAQQPEPASSTAALERVRNEIGGAAATADLVTLSGHPGQALVELAARAHADLVVSGTHGYGFFNRLILGSVATHLVRNAPCSLLAVPGSAVTAAAAASDAGV
ncbi:MAG TPA: universal stress protein [Gemmatimonadaceae bacterium]